MSVPAPLRRAGRAIRAFYWKAYEDNLTGQAAMVAYNLLLSILPLALLSLFIAGQVVQSNALEQSVIRDLRNPLEQDDGTIPGPEPIPAPDEEEPREA